MVIIRNNEGFIRISNDVFLALTSEAAVNCFGVKGMTVKSRTDGLVHLLKREFMGKGVRVNYEEDGTISVELHIAVDRGVNIPVICSSIESQVRWKVSNATGVTIKKVDVFVDQIITD